MADNWGGGANDKAFRDPWADWGLRLRDGHARTRSPSPAGPEDLGVVSLQRNPSRNLLTGGASAVAGSNHTCTRTFKMFVLSKLLADLPSDASLPIRRFGEDKP